MNGKQELGRFRQHLVMDEKSKVTIEKYMRDVSRFISWCGKAELDKELVISYKEELTANYAPASVNSMLAAVNSFLKYIGREDCRVRQLRIQRRLFSAEEKELDRSEYRKLVKAAGEGRMGIIMQTICGTGIRVSELKYITAEAVKEGRAVVRCKNKTREIMIPSKMRKMLRRYMKKEGIRSGAIFVTRSGRPLDRSNIWKAMKVLGEKAGIVSSKVFPHNLRHLFARTFYRIQKDIVRLADLLGHSSINTTRIYTMDSGITHREGLEKVCIILTT